ncbi:MAG: MaoC family dehydratase [Chloroflexi bacterium]|nr:MaoC family dehydratase [Chloroflexota bacterium]
MSGPSEVASVSRLIDQARVVAYATASRDLNPMHTDPAVAAATDFGRPVVHGMLLLALVSEAMGATFGARWAEAGTLKVRWRAPAMQPVTVTAHVAPRGVTDGLASYDVRCEDEHGTVLLTGTANVRLAP